MYRLPEHLQAALEGAATIVTAHSRQAFAIRSAWGEQQRRLGRGAWATPDVLPLSAWVARHWSRALDSDASVDRPLLLDPLHEQMLWEQVVASSAHERGLLHPHGAAGAALRSWQRVHDWAIDLRSLEHADSAETRAFLDWAHSVTHRMSEHRRIDTARALWQCPTGASVDAESFLMLGFDDDAPARRAMLSRIAAAGVRVHEVPERPAIGRASRLGCADRDAELEAAARWARRRLERCPTDRLMIAIGDLEQRRARVQRVFTEILDPAALLVTSSAAPSAFALEESLSLDRYPLVATALTALSLTAARVAFDEVSDWLRSPYWLSAAGDAARLARLDAALRRVAAPALDLAAVLESLANLPARDSEPPPSAELRRFAHELRATSLSPSGWSVTFARALAALGWPGDRSLDSAEFQTVEKFHEALRSLAALDRLLGSIDRATAVRLFRRLLEHVPFQPETGDTPVIITSRLGDPVIAWDGIWVCGLHAGAWPRAPRPDPFIPWAVQAAADLPGASARGLLDRARRTLTGWIASAPEVILSWPLQLDEESCDPSPLIAALPEAALPDEEAKRYSEVIRAAARRARISDERAPSLVPGVKIRGGARAVRLQSLCPFRANAEQRLGVQALERPEPGIDARTRGRLLHRALERIWSTLGDSAGLQRCSQEERHALIDAAVRAASIEVLERGRRWSAPTRLIETERLRGLLRQWLELEAARAPFRILGLERSFDCTVAGLSFSLRVDRLDQLADGRQVLVDYKSGEADVNDWSGERPEDPQLPLYAHVLERTPGALAYALLSVEECRFAGASSAPAAITGLDPVEDWPAQLNEWRGVIDRLAAAFMAGNALVDPLRSACGTCHLHAFCRIDELTRRSGRGRHDE